jgi:hypothetical protein
LTLLLSHPQHGERVRQMTMPHGKKELQIVNELRMALQTDQSSSKQHQTAFKKQSTITD